MTHKWADEAMRLKNQNVDLEAVNAQLLEALKATRAALKDGMGVGHSGGLADAAIKAATV